MASFDGRDPDHVSRLWREPTEALVQPNANFTQFLCLEPDGQNMHLKDVKAYGLPHGQRRETAPPNQATSALTPPSTALHARRRASTDPLPLEGPLSPSLPKNRATAAPGLSASTVPRKHCRRQLGRALNYSCHFHHLDQWWD